MGGDDGDSGGGGGRSSDATFTQSGSLAGGRGSNIGERQKSGFEQAAQQGFASVVGAATGVPGASTAFRSLAKDDDTFQVDLSTGQRIRTAGGATGGSGDNNSGSNRNFAGSSQGRSFNQSGGQNVASAADRAINRALGFQEEAAAGATTRLEEGREAALGAISPFAEAGTSALEQQLAFLGLSGADAEQAALQGFTQSPGAQFAQGEEEQAILRNALALGDVGGGRVKDELASRASGRFGQRLDTRLAQLGQLSGQGQQAAGTQANIQQNTAANLSNLLLGTGENQASAVLGQQVASAAAASEANRIAALQQQQQSQQDAAFKSQLFGLGASLAKPIISSFF